MTKWTIEPAHDKFRILRDEGFGRQYIIGAVNSREDAEYICKAVNNHEKLVESLKKVHHIKPEHIPFGFLDEIENLLQSIENEENPH